MATAVFTAKDGLLDRTIVPITQELLRLFPDGLVVMSGLFALLTLSYPMGIFFGGLLESVAIYHVLQYIASYLHVANITPTVNAASGRCRTGFSTTDLTMLSLFGSMNRFPFPSAPLYILSVASAYVFGTLNAQAKELEALGPAYSSRFYISVVLLCLFLLTFTLYRSVSGCDGVGNALLSVAAGIIIGTLIMVQNRRLFGGDAMNLIGIPLLRNRTANGQKIYVCPTTSKK